jgi:hypothetical protein
MLVPGMSVPLTVRCECGHTVDSRLGERVTCDCGREYDTSRIDSASYVDLRRMANRQRLYVRLGIVLAIGVGAITYLFFGIKGPALSVPLLALGWWRIVLPRFQRGQAELLRSVPVIQLEHSEPW